MRRYWIALIVIVVFTRGVMFISFPLGTAVADDNEAGQHFLIDDLLRGNIFIGNLRYQTGYAFVAAPVFAVARLFDNFDDRIVLAVQVGLSALVPFLVMDTVRRRWSIRNAFIVAVFVALDPFTLQWAHFVLPEWWIAWCTVVALWLLVRAHDQKRRREIIIAGLLLGLAVVGRLNYATSVAALGITLFTWTTWHWQQRWLAFLLFGMTSAGVLALYMIFIHYPSTGTWRISCITGNNLATGLITKNVPLVAANGEHTRAYLELEQLPPLKTVDFYIGSYPLWRKPDGWVTPEETAQFLAQPRPQPADQITIVFGTLYYYLGPCAADDMLAAASSEAMQQQTGAFLLGIAREIGIMLVQHPTLSTFHPLYLPRAETLIFTPTRVPTMATATNGFYNGQVVWEPGIRLFGTAFELLNAIKWLTPMALVWGLWIGWRRQDWFFGATAVVLLTTVLTLSIIARAEPRYYAIVAPLFPILIGGMLAWVLEQWQQRGKSRQVV